MTVGLFLLRCIQIGIPMSDLDYLDMGMILDIMTESGNDTIEWDAVATQEDFDRF